MKKVTLILPDKVMKVGGSSRIVYEREVEITPEEIVKIFCFPDYHSSYRFNQKEVKIVSVEDYQGR